MTPLERKDRRIALLYVAGLLLLAVLVWIGASRAKAQVASPQCIVNVSAQGTSDAITSAALPCGTTTNMIILTAAFSNATTTPTYQPIGSPALPITRADGGHIAVGDLAPGYVALLSSTGTSWVLLNPATLAFNPLSICVGDDIVDDTHCVQAAIDESVQTGLPLFFDGVHLYKITQPLHILGTADLEGFAPVGNDGVGGNQVCTWGLDAGGMNRNLLVATGESVHIENLCIQMSGPGASATAGAAIVLGGADQQSDDIEGNTIFRPYDGIVLGAVGANPNLVRNAVISTNTIRAPLHIAISVGPGTIGGATAGIYLNNNIVGCDTFDPNGVGFAFFDGAVTWDGTVVGPNNCLINSEIIPGANQNVNGEFYGVMGDSAGTHGGANPIELYIEPQSASAAIEWLSFSNTWAAGVVYNDTQVYIGNRFGGGCSNITFNGLTAHSGNAGGVAGSIVDIEGCDNITIVGSDIDAWLGGTTTNGILLHNGFGTQPGHIVITGNHIGVQPTATTLTNGINIQVGTNKLDPEYITITGNEIENGVTNAITTNLDASVTGQLWTMASNVGVDDLCPFVNAAANLVLPGAATCVHVIGSTAIHSIYPAWNNRQVKIIADNGVTLDSTGTVGICTGSITIAAAQATELQFGSGCWLNTAQTNAVVYAPLKADAFVAQDGVISGTSLSSATHSCASADVGKVVVLDIGGPGSPVGNPTSTALAQVSGGNSTTGGHTFYVKVWYDAPQVTGAPGVSLPSAEVSLAVTGTNILTVASPPRIAGVRGWHVGVGATTGTETQQDDATTYIPIGATWTMPLAGVINQGAVPGANNTAQGFVLHTKVDSCSGATYVLHDAGPVPYTLVAAGSWTTSSTTIPLGAGKCPAATVGSSVWDATLGHPVVIGTFASCNNGSGAVTLQTNPYVGGTSKPGVASAGAADSLVFGATGWFSIFTDNSAVLSALVTGNSRAELFLPCGNIGLDATTVPLDFIALKGCDQIGNLVDFNAGQVNAGTTFFLGSPTVVPFTLRRSVTLDGINYFYPGNMGTQPAPQVYPPLFTDNGTNTISGIEIRHGTFFNPFALMVQTNWSSAWAKTSFNDIHGYVIDTGFDRPYQSETLYMSDSNWNANNFHGVSVISQEYLNSYSSQYENIFVIPGNGDGINCQRNATSAVHISNSTFHGANHIFHVAGGEWTESHITGIGSGQNNALLYVSPLGSLSNVITFNGGQIQVTGSTDGEPAININGTCNTSHGNLFFDNVSVVSDYSAMAITGSESLQVTWNGGQINAGNLAGLGSPVYVANLNNSNLGFTMSNMNQVSMVTHGVNYDGVKITAAKNTVITGNNFTGLYNVLDTSAMSTGNVLFSDNIATATQGSFSLNVPPASGNIVIGTNSLDKPFGPPAITGTCSSTIPITTPPGVASNTSGVFQNTSNPCAGTFILTFATAAPVGWMCPRFVDLTTPADAWTYTSNTTTSITMTGTAVNNDTMQFSCNPY